MVARTSLDPRSLILPLRQTVRSLDKNQAIDNPRTMTQVVTTSNGGNRMIVFLLEIFALLALVLVAIADINRPFQGSVHVSDYAFRRAQMDMKDQ